MGSALKLRTPPMTENKTARKPKNWYAFRWACDLHEHRNSNMCSPEECHYCKRGKNKWDDYLSCKQQVCPVLKGKIPMNERQEDALNNKH